MAEIERIKTDETCEHCGEPIFEDRTVICGKQMGRKVECDCVRRDYERRRQEAVEKGRPLLCDRYRVYSGLLKRQQGQTFDTFVPQKGQEAAFEQVKGFTESFEKGENAGAGLLIVGSVGSGKTHLGAAIVNHIIETTIISDHAAERAWENRHFSSTTPPTRPNADHIFTSTVGLLEEVRQAYSGNGESAQEVVDRYCRCKLLVLDDIGTEKMTEWAEERLFELIDFRYNEMLPMVVTTNLTPDKMKAVVGDRIYDRLREMCKLVTVTAASQRKTA